MYRKCRALFHEIHWHSSMYMLILYIDNYQYEVNEMRLADVSLICKALGDSNRLEIVQMLSNGEKCGCRLLERFSITQPTLSHHMKILVECGLVNDRKEGKWHHYSLNCETLIEFKDSIGSLTCESCCDKKIAVVRGGILLILVKIVNKTKGSFLWQ